MDNQSWTGHDGASVLQKRLILSIIRLLIDRSEVSTLAGSIAETRSEPVTTFYSRPATAKDRAITTPTQEGQNMEARLVKAVCPEPPLISEVTVKMRKSISLSAGSQRSSLQGVEESLEEDTAASSLPSSHAGGDHSLQGDTAPSPAHGTSEVSGRSSSLSDSDIETIVCDPVSVAEATSETLSDLQVRFCSILQRRALYLLCFRIRQPVQYLRSNWSHLHSFLSTLKTMENQNGSRALRRTNR